MEMTPLCTRIFPYPFFEATPPGAAPGPPGAAPGPPGAAPERGGNLPVEARRVAVELVDPCRALEVVPHDLRLPCRLVARPCGCGSRSWVPWS